MRGAIFAIMLPVLAGCSAVQHGGLSAGEWQVLSPEQSDQLGRFTASGAIHAAGVLGRNDQTGLMVVCSDAEPSMIVLMVDGATERPLGDIANVVLTADQGTNLGLEFTFANSLMFTEGLDAVRLVALIQRANATLDVSVDGERDIRFAADRTDRINAVTQRCRAGWPGGSDDFGL